MRYALLCLSFVLGLLTGGIVANLGFKTHSTLIESIVGIFFCFIITYNFITKDREKSTIFMVFCLNTIVGGMVWTLIEQVF